MNEIEWTYAYVSHAKELAKQARIELYGLHYSTNFMLLFLRDMALEAIKYGFDYPAFAYDEATLLCIASRLNHLNYAIGNNSWTGNCCN